MGFRLSKFKLILNYMCRYIDAGKEKFPKRQFCNYVIGTVRFFSVFYIINFVAKIVFFILIRLLVYRTLNFSKNYHCDT